MARNSPHSFLPILSPALQRIRLQHPVYSRPAITIAASGMDLAWIISLGPLWVQRMAHAHAEAAAHCECSAAFSKPRERR